MKGLYILSILIFSIQVSSAQVFEIAEDRGFLNTFNNVIGLNDSTLVVSGNYNLTNSYFSGAYIKAIDHSGNLLWQYLTPLDTEVRYFNSLVLLPNGNLAALGSEQLCCDCTSPFFQIHIFSSDGELLTQQSFEAIEFWNQNFKTTLAGNIIGASFSDNALHAFATDGSALWTYEFGDIEIIHLKSQGNNFLAFGTNGISRIDETGMLTGFFPYNSPPDRILEVDENRTIILAEEVIYELNADLEINTVFFESNTNDIEYWLKSGDFIYIIAAGEIRKLNINYEMEQCTFFDPLPYHNLQSTWCNETFCAFAGFKEQEAGAYLMFNTFRSAIMYSVGLDNAQVEHYPDIALRHLTLNTFNVVEGSTPNVYSFSANASGYAVNTGDVTIQNLNLYQYVGQGFCGVFANSNHLNNLNLLPGDSIEFNMEVNRYSEYYPSGNAAITFCIFSSSPGNLSDREVLNDMVCVTQNFGVGIFENSMNQNIGIFPNPAGNQITLQLNISNAVMEYFIVDLSGRTVLSGIIQENTLPEIEVRNLENGSYLLQLKTGSTAHSGKFIVVR
jgi:hypothetical protein